MNRIFTFKISTSLSERQVGYTDTYFWQPLKLCSISGFRCATERRCWKRRCANNGVFLPQPPVLASRLDSPCSRIAFRAWSPLLYRKRGGHQCWLCPLLRTGFVMVQLCLLCYDLRKYEPLNVLQEQISGPDYNVRMCPSSRNNSCYCKNRSVRDLKHSARSRWKLLSSGLLRSE